ncbi:hypothetical protein C8R45DRAFT_1115175 [Mycena sanguinolenta]|nr:hypothetical protein C8R45DRAFT_1115175 [Mycena sanguinolenta]
MTAARMTNVIRIARGRSSSVPLATPSIGRQKPVASTTGAPSPTTTISVTAAAVSGSRPVVVLPASNPMTTGKLRRMEHENVEFSQSVLFSSNLSQAIVSAPSPTFTSSTYDSTASLSPILSTPSLSCSLSSTESSSGDRTIQMSMFMDDTMERGPLAHDVVVVCGNECSAASPTTLSCSAFEAAAAALRLKTLRPSTASLRLRHQVLFSNIAAQDKLMGSFEFDTIASSDRRPSLHLRASSASLRPIPSTPSLSYSPSLTEMILILQPDDADVDVHGRHHGAGLDVEAAGSDPLSQR